MGDFRVSRKADQDINRIYAYGVQKFGNDRADKYIIALFDQFQMITDQPFGFPVAYEYDARYRKCVCGVESIFYQIEEDHSIVIVRILGRQDLQRHLS